MQDVLFLTWIEHRRTRGLCQRLDIPLVELLTRTRGIVRYALLIPRTIAVLIRRRPTAVIVQTPSIVLGILCCLLRPLLRYRLVCDAHNEAVEPFLHPSALMKQLTFWLLRMADYTVVTNASLAKKVTARHGHPLLLPDSIPVAPEVGKTQLPGRFRIVLISTFAEDEPFEEVVGAMSQLDSDVQLFVTGRPTRLPEKVRASLPANITLTGFLDERAYWSLLASSDAILDLTTMPDCLVCGAYEGLALRKPLLLSDNGATRELFGAFAQFTGNEAQSIKEAIVQLEGRVPVLAREYESAVADFEESWSRNAKRLIAALTAP